MEQTAFSRKGHCHNRPQPQEVVLYQYDLADPMNPLGLLVAYAESLVLPAARRQGDSEGPNEAKYEAKNT